MTLGKKDFTFALKGLKVKRKEAQLAKENTLTTDLWASSFKRMTPSDPACYFIETGKTYTYGDIERYSNQVANFSIKIGLQAGDVVALYLDNKPEYFTTWLGFAKTGGRAALINFNLRQKSLLHSLKISGAKVLIFDKEFEPCLLELGDDLHALGMQIYCFDGETSFEKDFMKEIQPQPDTPVAAEHTARARGVKSKDPILLIYTSGTTGLPKAALVTHHRFFIGSFGLGLVYDICKRDRVYLALPLYHSAGGVVGVGLLFNFNAFLVIKKKFSASKWISDVRTQRCTVTQYIGEICRYILATPPKDDDKDNQLRLAFGNGLRPDVWKAFQSRFGIRKIGEFYAATEGAMAMVNIDGHFGAIGFISPLVQPIMPVALLKIDLETEELVRDSRGRCIECGPNEPGEFAALIYTIRDVKNFNGYTTKEESSKKIVTDVKKVGDSWFRSGDLMKKDRNGYVYFVDRIGDTFRWKGENCSTNEIAEIVSSSLKNAEVNVYGVQIPGKDGRAGMASLRALDESQGEFDLVALVQKLKAELPAYAHPLFLRVLPEMEVTSTFKHKKVDLRNQGFNPNEVKDQLYFLQEGTTYVPLTPEVYDDILSGKIRL